jgi:hypothetical protein
MNLHEIRDTVLQTQPGCDKGGVFQSANVIATELPHSPNALPGVLFYHGEAFSVPSH